MFSNSIFWLWFAGVAMLVVGLIARRKSLSTGSQRERSIALGPVFFGAALATFGAEHFSFTRSISQVVPAWMPGHLFWTYLVGTALICAALSVALDIQTELSSLLLGVMFASFVLSIHLPNVAANPKNRIVWAVAFRDLSFAGGAFALAAMRRKSLRNAARIMVAVPLLFFAVEHFLHPQFAPGVPLPKLTPAWVPIGPLWAYLTGAALLISGGTMLLDAGRERARNAAIVLGLWIALLAFFLYLPIFLGATPAMMLEGANYVADTLLFGGAVLLVAAILGDEKARNPVDFHRSAARVHCPKSGSR